MLPLQIIKCDTLQLKALWQVNNEYELHEHASKFTW